MIQDVVLLGRVAKTMTRWHEEARIRLNVGTKPDTLMSMSIVSTTHPLSQPSFNYLFKASESATEDKKHIGCVDSVYVASLRVATDGRSGSRKSQTRAHASRTMLI
jgi:hypothetical protein